MPTPLLRPLVRRHIETLRVRFRSPRAQQSRRNQTSSSNPNPNRPNPPPKATAKTEDPIPVPNTVAPLPFWQRLGPLTHAGQAYARAQRARPWATQLASSLFIYLCADISAQRMGKVGGGDGEHDLQRTGRSLVIGGVAAIPGYTWFMFLSRSFNYPSRLLSIGVKVAINQLCFTPIFNSYFFGAQALLSGDSLADTWERIMKTVPVSFVNSCKLWPAVTAFSFAFVPIEYRSIFAGVVAVGWQTYLSFLNREAEMEEASEKAAAGVKPAAAVKPVELGRRKERITA
ncbi:Uu.00g021820.m01.CDS01 [Anthostomella pinea]|uniref:Uu.00g021820.m01.CDS01 n=1 Tax=Anthostomella pinea TaxID=933095 RepID=A0AAI8VZR8_9PEZI|nr:Uu.00g021820.m01.CDS01 [Anthostomella pinea]